MSPWIWNINRQLRATLFFSEALFWLWLWQWFQRNRYQLAHCAKASFQAQGRKMRTLTEGQWQNQSVFIVFVLINLFMFFISFQSLSMKSAKSAVLSHRITWNDMDAGRCGCMPIFWSLRCRTFALAIKRKNRCRSYGDKNLILSREDTNLIRRGF